MTGLSDLPKKNRQKKIALSVLVVHQDYIGIRAAQYSKIAIKEYFKNYYATKNDSTESSRSLNRPCAR
ncbi:MAG: hypothetical protein R2860_03550 [Desulfobacterales bacterium]